MFNRKSMLVNRRAILTASSASLVAPLAADAAPAQAAAERASPAAAGEPNLMVVRNVNGCADRAEGIRYSPGGIGAIPRQLQDKLRDFSVNMADYVSLQAAIDAVNERGGGRVLLNSGSVDLGATGLTLYSNVVLEGATGRYAGATTRGTTLAYAGNGAAVSGMNILDTQVLNIDIDCTRAIGTNIRGIHFSGVWKTSLKNVTVRGVPPEKGYSILFDTTGISAPHGAQHNYLEQVECADGIIRLQGKDAQDGVTTTVLNTIRGYQYQIIHSQGVAINATAEGWVTGPGYLFDGNGTHFTMVGCDIEGTGSPGIEITNRASVREIGTVWAGFAGTTRVEGSMDALRTYGGPLEFIGQLKDATPVDVSRHGDRNAVYLREVLQPDRVMGGSQSGGRIWYRRIDGAEVQEADWRFHAFPKKSVVVSDVRRHTLLSIPVPNGSGCKVRATIWGTQEDDGVYTNYRECLVMNDGGSLVTNTLAAENLGVNMSLGFIAHGDSLLILCTPTTVKTSTVNLVVEIVGAFGAYS